MSSILSTLLMSADAMGAYDRVLQVTQNNVANASTPGYAKQSQTLQAMPFDPSAGASGGVRAGEIQSSRSEYAEQAVRQQALLLGQADQNVNSLTALQSNFDVTGASGLPAALNNLFQAFSAWGQTPNDSTARQAVLDSAQSVAHAFQQTATGLTGVTQDTNHQLQQTVEQVNQVVGQIAAFNSQIMQGDHNDAGLDAQLHSDLEQLSTYIPFTATQQQDGSTTILLNGQSPLLIGAQQYNLSFNLQQTSDPEAPFPSGPPLAHVQAADGTDLTAGITSGQLGALLHVRNDVLPSYIGTAYQPGDLNAMAKMLATRVNGLLTSGTLADGTTAGVPLFAYGTADDPNNDTNIAQTFRVSSTINPALLAANVAGPPAQSNGVPLALSKLANPQDPLDQVNGQSLTAFYGSMAARVGAALQDATEQQSVSQSAVAQAQNLRHQASGVDLNEEAVRLVEFQRAYEANARMVTVLDQLTQDTIQMLTP